MKSVGTKIFERYQERLSKIQGRTDLYLADWKRLNKTSAHVLFGYNKACGLLKSQDLIKYALASFNGKLELDEKTFKIYPEGAVSCLATIKREAKAMDSKGMRCVAETMYIDEKLKDIWEVQSNEEGKFLARVEKEDISNILAERKKRMFTKADINFKVIASGTYGAEVGDCVEFYFGGKSHKGLIKSLEDSQYKIKSDAGQEFCVDKEAILKIVEVNKKTKEEIKKELQGYYSKLYGNELGKEIVKD